MAQADVSFDVSKADALLIGKIVERGLEMARESGHPIQDKLSVHMDLTAVHANGTALRLRQFLNADDFNFAHDFFGIRRHIDRNTGELTECFRPRFAA